MDEKASEIIDQAIYNFLYGDEDENRRQFKAHFLHAAKAICYEVREVALEDAAKVADEFARDSDFAAALHTAKAIRALKAVGVNQAAG